MTGSLATTLMAAHPCCSLNGYAKSSSQPKRTSCRASRRPSATHYRGSVVDASPPRTTSAGLYHALIRFQTAFAPLDRMTLTRGRTQTEDHESYGRARHAGAATRAQPGMVSPAAIVSVVRWNWRHITPAVNGTTTRKAAQIATSPPPIVASTSAAMATDVQIPAPETSSGKRV